MNRLVRSSRRGASVFLVIVALAAVGPLVERSWAQSCQSSCAGLAGTSPQSPPARSYSTFIIKAYQGVGRFPNCLQQRAEYYNLVDAAAMGMLRQEAGRFVSTLIETQASYDVKDLITYRQTDLYQQRNPQELNDRAHIEAFVADLYNSFLQRPFDPAGRCFWSNNVCVEGRKKGLVAFEASIEFGDLVYGLYDDGPPCDFEIEPEPCRPGRVCNLER